MRQYPNFTHRVRGAVIWKSVQAALTSTSLGLPRADPASDVSFGHRNTNPIPSKERFRDLLDCRADWNWGRHFEFFFVFFSWRRASRCCSSRGGPATSPSRASSSASCSRSARRAAATRRRRPAAWPPPTSRPAWTAPTSSSASRNSPGPTSAKAPNWPTRSATPTCLRNHRVWVPWKKRVP